MHHYTESGLNNVFLKDGYNIQIIDDVEYISFDDIHATHKTISKALCNKTALLNELEVKFIRKELDLSEDDFEKLVYDNETVTKLLGHKRDIQIDYVIRHYLAFHYKTSFTKEDYYKIISKNEEQKNILISKSDYVWSTLNPQE